VEQQAVTPEPLDLVLDGGVGDVEFLSDLAVGGAGENPKEEGAEEPGVPEPIAGREGL
jgi:hypothetical protein